jgi:hypothetical protein
VQPILFKLTRLRALQASQNRIGVPPFRTVAGTPAVALRIFGITKDSTGAALGSCDVHLFRTIDDVEVDQVVSDASGNYEFRSASLSTAYYVVAYKAGAPDVSGTTVNTLAGVA